MWSAFFSSLGSPQFVSAAVATLWLTAAGQAVGVAGGLALAPLRMSRFLPLRAVATAYLWLFRGTPELLQLIAWYAVLPLVGVNLSLPVIAVLGLGANEVARMAEIVRAGLQSVDRGQLDATRVLGMSRRQAALYVTIPQALRLILPPTGNELNIMFKTTSLVSVIGITELLRQSQLVAETSHSPLGVYLAALVYYLVLTTLWGAAQGWLESRHAHASTRPGFLASWWGGLTGNIASRS